MAYRAEIQWLVGTHEIAVGHLRVSRLPDFSFARFDEYHRACGLVVKRGIGELVGWVDQEGQAVTKAEAAAEAIRNRTALEAELLEHGIHEYFFVRASGPREARETTMTRRRWDGKQWITCGAALPCDQYGHQNQNHAPLAEGRSGVFDMSEKRNIRVTIEATYPDGSFHSRIQSDFNTGKGDQGVRAVQRTVGGALDSLGDVTPVNQAEPAKA